MKKDKFRIVMLSVNTTWSCGTVGKFGNAYIDRITAFLRNSGYLVDLKYFRRKEKEEYITSEIKNNYNFYGFIVTKNNYKKCVNIVDIIKDANPYSVVAFYGDFPTLYYKEIFNETKNLDYIVLGDAGECTDYLIKNLLENKLDFSSPFIAAKNNLNNKKVSNSNSTDLFPAFDFYENDTPEHNSQKLYRIQTKNNVCSGNCSFCIQHHDKIIYKNIISIVNEIKYVHDTFGVRKFFFNDNNIFDPNNEKGKEHVYNLCKELNKLHFKASYQCYCKSSSLHDTSEDHKLLKLMKSVGFNMFYVGIESGNQEDLDLYNKLTTLEDNNTILRMLKNHKLMPVIGFIGFHPYSTRNKIENNFKYLIKIKCSYLSNYLYSFMDINNYTDMYKKIKEDNLLVDDGSYCSVKYNFVDESIIPLVEYIKYELQPKTFDIAYEVDDVLQAYLDCSVWKTIDTKYLNELKEMKKKDLCIIKKYLSILFIEFDTAKFKAVENVFWNHFIQNQNRLKEIMNYIKSKYRPVNTNFSYGNISSYLLNYSNSILKNKMSYDLCPDVVIGEINLNTNFNLWISPNDRKKHIDKLLNYSSNNKNNIIIILESPHIDEFKSTTTIEGFFDDNIKASPALGKTGRKIRKYIANKLINNYIIDSNTEYQIILMSSIQYQCSLGCMPTLYRDHIWLNLWFEKNLKLNFRYRLEKLNPSIIINCCTIGDHHNEPNLPKGTKTRINRKYLNYCGIQEDIIPASIKDYVQDEIDNFANLHKQIKLYSTDHPCTWNDQTQIKEIIINKNY